MSATSPQGANLHIYPSPCTRESRMFRLTKSLADHHVFKTVYLIGIGEDGLPDQEDMDGVRHIWRIPRSAIYRRSRFIGRALGTLQWSFSVWRRTRGMNVACVNAHSLAVLPLCAALKIRHKAKLVYDTHELETETIATRGLRRTLSKLTEKLLIGSADHVFCVGDRIAEWYQVHYRILRPTVVRNIPETPPAAGPESLRQRLNIPAGATIFCYAGLLAQDRGIEDLLDVFTKTGSGRHLAIIGSGPDEARVIAAAARHENIHHIPAVQPHEVVPYLRSADAGISMDIKGCLSYLYSLPNKFFEYIQAGIPILVGGMPEQKDLVEKYDIGWVTPLDNDDLAQFIDGLSAQDIALKKANVEKAQPHLNWGIEEKTLLGAYRTLMAIEKAA